MHEERITHHKDGKWARQLIAMQDAEGKWGRFHSMASYTKPLITTEQALRRLEILGYTIEDGCIQKAVAYMDECLSGEKQIPDPPEKIHDWGIFTSMLLAAWIRRFTPDNGCANAVAAKWVGVVTAAFEGGEYDHQRYVQAYHDILGMKPRGGRLIDFVQFYGVSILQGGLDPRTEEAVVKHILDKPDGIYYIYEKCMREPPQVFESRQASRYLAGLELVAGYEAAERPAKKQLQFAVDWLESNRQPNGKWDMGSGVKDGVYFPLSDDWRRRETRENDCTERIERLLGKLGS